MQIRLSTTSIYGYINSGQLSGQPTTFKYGNSGQFSRQPTELPTIEFKMEANSQRVQVLINNLNAKSVHGTPSENVLL